MIVPAEVRQVARRMRMTRINQLWVADITYIRLKAEFVYLAVILDAFSRKVIGWALDRTMASRLTIAALERAIAWRRPRPGLVRHSDRGLQYAPAPFQVLSLTPLTSPTALALEPPRG